MELREQIKVMKRQVETLEKMVEEEARKKAERKGKVVDPAKFHLEVDEDDNTVELYYGSMILFAFPENGDIERVGYIDEDVVPFALDEAKRVIVG